MRLLAKIATTIMLLSVACTVTLSTTAFAQDTPTTVDNSASDNGSDLVTDIIKAAEQNGVRIIVIDSAPQQDNTNTEATLTPDIQTAQGYENLTAQDYENLPASMAPKSASTVMKIQSDALAFRNLLKEKIAGIPGSLVTTKAELNKNSPTGDSQPYVRALYWSILLLAFGAWLEHEIYVKRIVARWLKPDLLDNPTGYLQKVPLLIKRAMLKILGVIISMLIAYFAGSVIFKADGAPPDSIQFTIATIYLGYAAFRLLPIMWRLILAPFLDQYRIPHFSNKDARHLYCWLWVISSINIAFLMISIWLFNLGGESHLHAALASSFGLILSVVNILMVVINRKALSRAIRGGRSINEVGSFIKVLSQVWLVAAIGYFTFAWLELTYRIVTSKPLSTPLIAGAYGILIASIFVYALANFFIEYFSQRARRFVRLLPEESNDPASGAEALNISSAIAMDDIQGDTALFQHPLATYEDLARRVSGILAALAGLWALTYIWDIEHSVMDSENFQRSTDALAIIFFGYILYHIVRIWIDTKIQEEGGEASLDPGDEGGASSASRLATLLPLFRNFMLVVIGLSVAFSALLELGINVSPLFASAGVVGLAIGFGAQTLVRDIFSGAFYLFDDAFRRGEYVDIGSVKGTVEKISVRSFQLRHHLGPLHTIPFGEIQSLTNYSRDWVMMKLPLRLTYDTDPERVRKLVKKLGQELMNDPEIGHTFLQPLKSQGVLEMLDSAMIVRVKFMAKPGDQWVIRKRVYQEIRDLFHREGIQFANKEVTVRLAGDVPKNIDDKQMRTIVGAAVGDDDVDGGPDIGDDR